MKFPRPKFSTRLLLVWVSVIAVVVAGSIRFGPHLVWLANRWKLPSANSIPTRTLVVGPATEKLVRCRIGPFAIGLPKPMCENFVVQRDRRSGSVSLRFTDGTRTALVNLTPMKDFVVFPSSGFPNETNATHSQLYRKIASVNSSDFSFLMTADELRWHKWLITNRQLLPVSITESIEHIDKLNVEGNLLRFSAKSGIAYSFEWATIEGDWKGAVTFFDQTDNPDWIRSSASTFDLTGDPATIQNATDVEIEALVAVGQSEDATAK